MGKTALQFVLKRRVVGLAYTYTAFSIVKVAPGKVALVQRQLENLEFVEEAIVVTGGIDVVVKIHFDDIRDLRKRITKQISQVEGVRKTQTHIALVPKSE